jgi:hypothetical protein
MSKPLNLKEWTSVFNGKPLLDQKVLICDADHWGNADYVFDAVFNGVDFIVDNFGRVDGVSFWKAGSDFSYIEG